MTQEARWAKEAPNGPLPHNKIDASQELPQKDHTPGPWKIRKEGMGHLGGYLIAQVLGKPTINIVSEKPWSADNRMADVRLIAQAPDVRAERDSLKEKLAKKEEINSFLRQDKRELVGAIKETLAQLGDWDELLRTEDTEEWGHVQGLRAALALAEKEKP